MNDENKNNVDKDANKDPITGAPGSHPVGTGLGAMGVGAATGAMGGAVAGPIGVVAGAVVGAVVGGVVGKAAAEAVNPTVESKYWAENHATRPYAEAMLGYDDYAPAYKYGWESYSRRSTDGMTFESSEGDLSRGWNQAKGSSRLSWDKAKHATREAWNRVEAAAHMTVTPPAR